MPTVRSPFVGEGADVDALIRRIVTLESQPARQLRSGSINVAPDTVTESIVLDPNDPAYLIVTTATQSPDPAYITMPSRLSRPSADGTYLENNA